MQVKYWKCVCLYWVFAEATSYLSQNDIFYLHDYKLWLIWRRTRCLIENKNLLNTSVSVTNILLINHWSHKCCESVYSSIFLRLAHFDMCTIPSTSSTFQNIGCWGLCYFLRQGNISYILIIIWMCAGAPMMQIKKSTKHQNELTVEFLQYK